MDIDWSRKADPTSVAGSASLLLNARARASSRGLESTLETSGTGANEHEQLERLRDALAAAAPAAPGADQSALNAQVLDGARTALAKLNEGEPAENFTLGEHIGLESVILTDGTRPSLYVKDGFVDLLAPNMGDWSIGLSRFQAQIRMVIKSVGRIDIPVRPWFAGTCFVIASGLVVTNRHVLEVIATQDASGAWTLKWPGATTVNFVGEDGAADSTKFKIVGVSFAGPDPINNTVNFAHLDAGILRVDVASDPPNAFPAAVTFENDVTQPSAQRDLYVVGFPGQPKVWMFGGVPASGTETSQVISTLFNNKFGVKRLAPGGIKAGPGQVTGDAKKWICTHDASTLSGNSGSCVVDLGVDGFRVVGLHFAGANRDQNWAHVAACLHEYLAVAGLPRLSAPA